MTLQLVEDRPWCLSLHFYQLKTWTAKYHAYLYEHFPPGQPSNATTVDWDEWKAIIVDDDKERKRLRDIKG